MAEETKQQEVEVQNEEVQQVEVTVRDGEYAGLTKKNEEYMFRLNKLLEEKGYDLDKKQAILETTYKELKEKQRQGITAVKLFGTVTEYVQEIVSGRKKGEEPPREPIKFWKLAVDNILIIFMMFCVLYGVLGFFGNEKDQQNNGWLTLFVTSIIVGLGLAFFYKMMDPQKMKEAKNKWLRGLGITALMVVVWLLAFGLIPFIPQSINVPLNPIIYAILAVAAFFVRNYLKKKYNFQRIGY